VIDNAYYSHEFQGDYDLVSVGSLDLEEGGNIADCRLAIATFGELNAAKDNAILVTTWFSGTHSVSGQGQARRSDRRHRAEHPARLPLRRDAQRSHPVRPGLERGRLPAQHRRQ